jgi:tape measure domain-containing protein
MAEDKLVVGLSADIKDLKDKLKETNTLLNNYAKDAENAGTKASGSFSQITGAVKGLVGAYISLQAAQTALVTSFNNSLKMDALQGAFDVIFGSSAEGTRQLDRLRAKANELGLEFTSLASAYKLFAGATTQSGMSISETNRIFDSVAKTSAVLKLSAEDTEGALRALAQMMGKGTVQAEELRGQLGERVPGAFKLAANAMGVTEQQLGKMLEQGQVMASDLLPKLADELDKAFGNKVKGDVSGLNAEWNKFKNNIFSSTSGFADFFATLLGGLNKTIDAFKDIFKYFGNDSQFQADIAFKSLSNALDAVNSKDGLNKLILDFTKIQATLQKGTPMWYAYTNAIIEAGKRIKDMQSTTSKVTGGAGRVVGGAPMDLMAGASEQMKVANELFQLYNKMPQVLGSLGNEYASNPFFRDLINGTLKKNLGDLRGEMENLRITSNIAFTDPAMDAYIANMQNIVNLVGNSLTQSFESALTSGQDFFKVLGQALKALVARLVAAVAAALALTAIIGIFTGGAGLAAVGGFTGILKGLSGFNFGAGGTGDRVVSAVGAGVGAGNVSFEIRGDKLYGVLQNYQSRLDRLQ